MNAVSDDRSLLNDLVSKARRAGADEADAIFTREVSALYAQRLGQPEKIERAEIRAVGLRVIVGKAQGIVSSSSFDQAALNELVGRAIDIASSTPPDPYVGLAQPDELAKSFGSFDAFDPVEPSSDQLRARAAEAEDAALSVHGVANSEGAQASWGQNFFTLCTSNGFVGTHSCTTHGISVCALAGSGTAMETDYDWCSVAHAADLPSPTSLGRTAGERAVRRLNPKKLMTATMPVVYETRAAGQMLRHLAGAISGAGIARGTSFLKDSLGKLIFPEAITIVDDPFRLRSPLSYSFDGEGLPRHRNRLIDKGVLTSWLLDIRSARQLKMKPTGHALRSISSPPHSGTANIYIEAGSVDLSELISDIKAGFFVTSLLGSGVNGVTGDYSRGASGFFIDHGEIAYPVSEVTIADNLKAMFKRMVVSNDLVFKTGCDSPSIRIDGMIISGR